MKLRRLGIGLLATGMTLTALGCATGGYHSTTPEEHAMWRAAEAGNLEAQRRVAVDLSPNSAPEGARIDSGHAAFWYQEACSQRYANAAVDFLRFAEYEEARTRDSLYLSQALACLHSAIEQGHRAAIRAGATRAAKSEKDFRRAYYLYALLAKEDPAFADRRWEIADQLIQGEPERIEERAAEWLSRNSLKGDDDFLRELSSSLSSRG
ncbi:MAG: hypothetical protein AB8G23_06035 [Myxococcota bacterium]